MSQSPVDLSLIIACYNEEAYLAQNVGQIRQTLDQCRWQYELIFIDDCSSDGTRDVITQITQGRDDCRIVFHESNAGRGQTVAEGIRMARGTVAGFVDIDLEVHCRYVPSMAAAILDDGYDVATARRVYLVTPTPTGILRLILSKGYRQVARLILASPFQDTETGFKFFRKDSILPVLDQCHDGHWFWDTEIMLESRRAGLKIIEIPTLFRRQSSQTSSLRVFSDTIYYIKAMRRYRRQKRIESTGGKHHG